MPVDLISAIKLVFAAMLTFALYIEYKRSPKKRIIYFFFLFLLIFIKDFSFALTGLEGGKYTQTSYANYLKIEADKNTGKLYDYNIYKLIQENYLYWQFGEVLFYIIFLIIFFKIIESEDDLSTKIHTKLVTYINLFLFFIAFALIKTYPDFFMGMSGRLILVFWKIIILSIIIIRLGVMTELNVSYENLFFVEYREYAFYGTGFLILFYFVSIFFVVSHEQVRYWAYAQLVGYFFYGGFAYKMIMHTFNELIEITEAQKYEKEVIIEILKRVGEAVGGSADEDSVLELIVDASMEATRARGGTIVLYDKETDKLKPRVARGLYPPTKNIGGTTEITKEKDFTLKFLNEEIELGEGIIGEAAQKREALLIKNAKEDSRVIQTAKGIMDIRTIIAVPIIFEDELLGVLSVLNKYDYDNFFENDLRMITTFANQCAITINNVNLYKEVLDKKQAERELDVAGQIQQNLLPHTFPKLDSVDFYGFSKPAKGVGGDYFDIFNLDDNKYGVIMADVSGKGVPASLVMVMIRSILKAIINNKNMDAQETMSKLNTALFGDLPLGKYATTFYFIYDATQRAMNYCNGGHGPLIIYHSKMDEFEMLDTQGMPVGIVKETKYENGFISLQKGDIAVLYTDGITEAMNPNRELFETERLKVSIKKAKNLDAKGIAEMIYKDVNSFKSGEYQHDDETLFVMKVN